MNFKQELFFWLLFLSFLTLALLIQISFGYHSIQFTPYITLPAIIFFFLYHKTSSSVLLALFMGFLSSAFSSLSAPLLIFFFLSLLVLILFIKQFFFYKSFLLFLFLVFLFSLWLPSLYRLTHELSWKEFILPDTPAVLRAFCTLLLSLVLFPPLKQHLQKVEAF